MASNMGELGAEARAARVLQEGASRPIDEVIANIESRPPATPGSEPTLAEVALDPGLAGVQRGHTNTAQPNLKAAIDERHASNAIARTRAVKDAMGDGSPQAIQDLGAAEVAAAERATAEQQAARQAEIDAGLAGRREATAGMREDADAGFQGGVERVGPTADRDVTGGGAREIWDSAYAAAKQRSRDAYNDPALTDVAPISVPRQLFDKIVASADDFYGDGGGVMPAELQAIIDDLAEPGATTRTLTNIDRRLADFAGGARMAGRRSEAAFAERVRSDLTDFARGAAPPEYRAALEKAKAVRAEQGRVFETGDVATSFAKDKFGNAKVGDNELPTRLVRPGAAGGDTADRLIAAVGSEQAEAIVRQELRRIVEERSLETAAQARTLATRYGETLRRFPAVQRDLREIETLAAAREAARTAEREAATAKPTPEEAAAVKERAALHEAIDRTPLARIANPEVDPSAFITGLLGRSDGGRQFRFLVNQTKGNADAQAGIRRALGDYIVEKGKTTKTNASGDVIPGVNPTREAIDKVVARGGDALTNQQRIVLKQVSRELKNTNFAFNASRPSGSDTMMNKGFKEFVGKAAEAVPGAPNGVGSVVRKVLSLLDSGDQVNELLTQAILDPDFAATLLKRPTEQHWAQIKAGMVKGRKAVAASAASHPVPANDVGSVATRIQGGASQSATGTRAVADEPSDKGAGVNNGSGQTDDQDQRRDDPAYRAWLSSNGVHEDPTYDTYAAFKAGLKPDSRGHLDDRFKLPSHPTFSTDSIHNGEGGKQGGVWVKTGGKTATMPEGTWVFRASSWNLKNMSKAELKAYFDHTEPGMTIIFPDGERYTGKASS